MTRFYLTVIFFLFSSAVVICSCTEKQIPLCEQKGCVYTFQSPRFIKINDGTAAVWNCVTKNELIPLDIPVSDVPLFYHPDNGLLLAKRTGVEHISLLLYQRDDDTGDGVVKKRRDLPPDTVSVITGCVRDDGTAVILHEDKGDETKRSVLSFSNTHFDVWRNYGLFESSLSDDVMQSLLGMPDSEEKPVRVTCGDKGAVFVTTFRPYNDVSMITVYRFRRESAELVHHLNYFTRASDATLTPFFSADTDSLYVFDGKRLIKQTGLGFPEEHELVGAGSVIVLTGGAVDGTVFHVPENGEISGSGRFLRPFK